MSVNDLSGRLLLPSTGRLQRLLSKRASTDCCSIRFSLRMMTSGALRSTSFLRRLLRLMMRRDQVVGVPGGEIAASHSTQRPQVGRDDRDALQDHPLRLVLRPAQAAVAQRLHDLEALDQVALLLPAGPLLGVEVGQFLAQVAGDLDEVEAFEQQLDRLGAHVGLEGVAVALAGLAELVLGEELAFLQLGVAGVNDHVVLEVDDLLQGGGLHVEQGAQAAGHGLEEPDVDDGRGQLDVAHALAADAGVGDLDAAAVADHALVLHAAVLAAGALPVLLRAEDALAEQAVLFRPVGAVVDGFGLLDLAKRPAPNVMGASQADADRPIVVDAVVVNFRRSGVASTHGTPSFKSSGPGDQESRPWWCATPGAVGQALRSEAAEKDAGNEDCAAALRPALPWTLNDRLAVRQSVGGPAAGLSSVSPYTGQVGCSA